MPASAQPDYDMIGEIYHEFYWGADELRKRYGREPRYLPDFYGLVHNEEMLFPPDFFRMLRAMGIPHLGMITGRKGPEVDMALEMMEAHAGERWWDVVVSADDAPKPDPRALQLAIAGIPGGIGGGLYIGDTGDDLDVVKHYRAVKQEGEPQILAAMLVYEHEVEVYKQRGADFVIRTVTDVVECLPERFYGRIADGRQLE
jgi:HAD superfamily phosphatase